MVLPLNGDDVTMMMMMMMMMMMSSLMMRRMLMLSYHDISPEMQKGDLNSTDENLAPEN